MTPMEMKIISKVLARYAPNNSARALLVCEIGAACKAERVTDFDLATWHSAAQEAAREIDARRSAGKE